MPSDGTSTINPSGKTMYLILSGKRRSGPPRVQLKVSSIKEASEEMAKWISKTGVYRRDVSSSHVYVGGMTVAKIGYDGKVYRVDPFTKEVFPVDAPDRILYDPEEYKKQQGAEEEKKAKREAMRQQCSIARHMFVRHVFNEVYAKVKDNPFLSQKKELELMALRLAEPLDTKNSTPDGFSFYFARKMSSGYDATVKVVLGFQYWDSYKVKTSFAPSLRGRDDDAVIHIADIDGEIELLTFARDALTAMKSALESEQGKTFLETYQMLRKTLDT